jgi:hypothetical protein
MTKTKFGNLVNFFGGYFHQDWDLDARNYDEVLEMFVKHNPSNEVANVVKELDALLAMGLSDLELRKALTEDLLCCYIPPCEEDLKKWLILVRNTLRKLISIKAGGI